MVYFGKYNITKIYNSLFQHSVANGGGKDFLIDGGGGGKSEWWGEVNAKTRIFFRFYIVLL